MAAYIGPDGMRWPAGYPIIGVNKPASRLGKIIVYAVGIIFAIPLVVSFAWVAAHLLFLAPTFAAIGAAGTFYGLALSAALWAPFVGYGALVAWLYPELDTAFIDFVIDAAFAEAVAAFLVWNAV